MAQIEYNGDGEQEGTTPLPFALRLGSVKACRQTLARLTREVGRGTIDGGLYRVLVWGISQMIAYWKLEKDLEIEQRIQRLEAIAEVQR